jgi:L-threonate 2-dehydrogenase
MKPIVAVVSPGAMGSAIARRLAEHGVEVRTWLAARSASSVARAREAGMKDTGLEGIRDSQFFLSVVPPASAVSLARRFAESLAGTVGKPLYVDCNAVCPETTAAIASIIGASGAEFIDASIIGGPPRPGGKGPALYASGPGVGRLTSLRDFGLDIRVLGAEIGEASALKMAYAGITKGLNALGIAMILAASRAGVAETLRRELGQSQPDLLAWFSRYVPGAFGKAQRWVGEMEEIAKFASESEAAAQLYSGAAALYAELASDSGDEKANNVRAFLR